MATAGSTRHDHDLGVDLAKPCFIITPLGQGANPIRRRAKDVYDRYIKPACMASGYEPLRSDPKLGGSIIRGITNALNCAPMAIAYMGGLPWNPNVMIEIGYRLSTKLPLVYVCDQDQDGNDPPFPFHFQNRWIVTLPIGEFDPAKLDDLIAAIHAEERESRTLEWLHPIALINVRNRDTDSPDNLLYTAASREAAEIFGKDGRLVGMTMRDFLLHMRHQMPPAQYHAFSENQEKARKALLGRMTDESDVPAGASIPLFFNNHENDRYNGRAYLPVILQDFTPENRDWYNLRMLYLEVTSICKRATWANRGEIYYCPLDVNDEGRLDPISVAPPRSIFLSYSREDRDLVEQTFSRLKEEFHPEIEPWMDLEDLFAVPNFPEKLTQAINKANHFLIFFGKGNAHPGQIFELDMVRLRMITEFRLKTGLLVTPILLDGCSGLPESYRDLGLSGFVTMSAIEADFERTMRRVLFPEP